MTGCCPPGTSPGRWHGHLIAAPLHEHAPRRRVTVFMDDAERERAHRGILDQGDVHGAAHDFWPAADGSPGVRLPTFVHRSMRRDVAGALSAGPTSQWSHEPDLTGAPVARARTVRVDRRVDVIDDVSDGQRGHQLPTRPTHGQGRLPQAVVHRSGRALQLQLQLQLRDDAPSRRTDPCGPRGGPSFSTDVSRAYVACRPW
jgi:hypothetical protein